MDEDTILGVDETQEEIDELDVEGLDEVKFTVKLVDVSRNYSIGKKKILALRNVNLEISTGEFVVISGYSGSGKTTLLNVIGAIDYASEGRVIIQDVPIEDYDESFRALFRLSNTGYIFQSYNLISTLTAVENVMFPMQLTEEKIEKLREQAMQLLERVKLHERWDHLPWQLSSGEQQRVAIVRAMANDPPIILADEPTANLDAESAQMIRDLLQDMHVSGKTLVIMTHDEKIINHPDARHLKMEKGVLSTDV
ncbi:MAG: ABC transporter ATP-binding protein [Candidatus Thorarchaeota archaeon]